MISILGGELLSSLGDNALEKLSTGTYTNSLKQMKINDEDLAFPYYSIDDKARKTDLNVILFYLEDVVNKAILKLGLKKEDLKRCGLFLGSSSYDVSICVPLEKNIDGRYEDEVACERVGNGYYAQFLVDKFGLSDISLTYNTACTSSANAMIDASSMLEGKLIDYALVVGMELFSPASFEGFASMQLLSQKVLASFDKNREGIIMGEAFSALFLSTQEISPSSWSYLSGSSQCETHSVTGAHMNGEGIAKVIEKTLSIAGCKTDDISAIKAHGTGSQLNDIAEVNGMKLIFEKLPPFFSLKPYIGHTLGSCGSSELLVLLQCVDAGFIPSSPNFKTQDEALLCSPLKEKQDCTEGVFLLNYFGFGGNNTSILIQKTFS